MSEDRSKLEGLLDTLRQQRDQLAVKMHLAKMEAKEEFDRLSVQVDKLADKAEPARKVATRFAKEGAGAVIDVLSVAAEEVKRGLDRVRKSIGDTDSK